MKRNELEKIILNQHPELKLTNLKNIGKPHLECWVNNNNNITLPTEVLIKIFSERNQRAEINQKLNNENFSLSVKLNSLLNEFINFKESEIVKAGQWLLNALSTKDTKERKKNLDGKDLLHKDDHQNVVIDLTDTIKEQKRGIKQQTNTATKTIQDLENTNDSLRRQLSQIQNYIVNNHGNKTWSTIAKYIQNNPQNISEIELSLAEEYIVNNYGTEVWLEIEKYIQNNLDKDKGNENY